MDTLPQPPTCEAHRQDGTRCDDEATTRVYWPGSAGLKMCVIHAMQAQNIATAMGFGLLIDLLMPESHGQRRGA